MASTGKSKRTDRASAGKFEQVARALLEAADALSALAGDEETYGNAIGLLSIHAAISFADAVCIAYGEKKSTAGDHEQAARLLRSVVGNRLTDVPERDLLRLVKAKDSIAYQGRYYPLADGRDLLEKARRFALWAIQMYQERPA